MQVGEKKCCHEDCKQKDCALNSQESNSLLLATFDTEAWTIHDNFAPSSITVQAHGLSGTVTSDLEVGVQVPGKTLGGIVVAHDVSTVQGELIVG